jgi:hypothetical protein
MSISIFTANDGVNGTELWASNGTPAGTRIKIRAPINQDQYKRSRSGTSAYLGNLPFFNGLSFLRPQDKSGAMSISDFTANDGSNGTEPWMSNKRRTAPRCMSGRAAARIRAICSALKAAVAFRCSTAMEETRQSSATKRAQIVVDGAADRDPRISGHHRPPRRPAASQPAAISISAAATSTRATSRPPTTRLIIPTNTRIDV